MIIIDETQSYGIVTGIERVTQSILSKLKYTPNANGIFIIKSNHRITQIVMQWALIPLLGLVRPKSAAFFPGLPPSIASTIIFRHRAAVYIHDLFLEENLEYLGLFGKYYMRPSFRFSIRHSHLFFSNSLNTKAELKKYVRKEAVIYPLRPCVSNVFNLSLRSPAEFKGDAIHIVTIGTIEPRKNIGYALSICHELEKISGKVVLLHLVGRSGWGSDTTVLSAHPNAVMHGYLSVSKVRDLIENKAALYLACSKDEGLGLPLLEVQYSGIPIAAVDILAFREVLADSGIFISKSDSLEAARSIWNAIRNFELIRQLNEHSVSNLARWGRLAEDDIENAQQVLSKLR